MNEFQMLFSAMAQFWKFDASANSVFTIEENLSQAVGKSVTVYPPQPFSGGGVLVRVHEGDDIRRYVFHAPKA